MKENIVIVEPVSTGVNYIHDIRELGYNPISLEIYQTEENFDRLRAFHDGVYALNGEEPPQFINADKSYEKTLEMIRELNPIAVIPGCDEGIILATKLAHDLGLPGNDPKNLKKMMSKQHMHEALKKAGIRYIKSQVITSFDEAKEFASNLDNPYVVVKPSIGKSTMGVCICKTDDELKEALKINKELSFDIASDDDEDIIIQEYIGGEEFIIDSVCCEGHNRVIAALRYEKFVIEGRGAVYDYAEAIDESHPYFKQLAEYNDKVIEALDLKYGAIHGEYKFDENGPVLIEMNCRVSGPFQKYTLVDTVWGEHSTEVSLESYINPEKCIEKSDKPLELLSDYIIKVIIIYKDIDVVKSNVESAFDDLESFRYGISFGDDQVYPKTVDLATSGGMVFLTNKNKEKLLEDLQEIKRIEEFEVERIFDIR